MWKIGLVIVDRTCSLLPKTETNGRPCQLLHLLFPPVIGTSPQFSLSPVKFVTKSPVCFTCSVHITAAFFPKIKKNTEVEYISSLPHSNTWHFQFLHSHTNPNPVPTQPSKDHYSLTPASSHRSLVSLKYMNTHIVTWQPFALFKLFRSDLPVCFFSPDLTTLGTGANSGGKFADLLCYCCFFES